MPKARAAKLFEVKGDDLAPEVRSGRLVLRASAEFRRKNVKGSLIAGLLFGAFLTIFDFAIVGTAMAEVAPHLAWVKWPIAAFIVVGMGLFQAWLEARRVGVVFWTFDRGRDAVLKGKWEVANIGDVRAIRVKGAWRREGYRDSYKRLLHHPPQFVYHVELETGKDGRVEINHWSPERIKAVVAALEAGIGAPAVWKGALPGDALPPVPEDLLAKA